MDEKIADTREITQEDVDKISRAWMRMVNCIVHDMTTPLACMRLMCKTLEKIYPEVMKGYKLALSHDLMQPTSMTTDRYLQSVEKIAADMNNQAEEIQAFLNLLHPYNQKLLETKEDKVLQVSHCLRQALEQYPFVDKAQSGLVHVDYQKDFNFRATDFFAEHLFFNLLEAAFNRISLADKGEIYISTEKQPEYNVLHVKNTAGNTDKDAVEQAFRYFFFKRGEEVIPGMGFCRLKLLQMGGDILCHGLPEGNVDYEVRFPK